VNVLSDSCLTCDGFLLVSRTIALRPYSSLRFTNCSAVQILSKIAPEVAAGESSTQLNSPLMQLLRLAWGYKEVNDDHIEKVGLCTN
jgi:hypothetical protein